MIHDVEISSPTNTTFIQTAPLRLLPKTVLQPFPCMRSAASREAFPGVAYHFALPTCLGEGFIVNHETYADLKSPEIFDAHTSGQLETECGFALAHAFPTKSTFFATVRKVSNACQQ